MPFQIHALPPGEFEHLFEMSDDDLKAAGALRVTAENKPGYPCRVSLEPGYPCRVSLEDAEIGEEVILANHTHLSENSPYKASHAIYVRRSAKQGDFGPDEIPAMLSCRLLSVRGFGDDHLMKHADVVEGTNLAVTLRAFFDDPAIAYVHIHYAMRGCFAAKATR